MNCPQGREESNLGPSAVPWHVPIVRGAQRRRARARRADGGTQSSQRPPCWPGVTPSHRPSCLSTPYKAGLTWTFRPHLPLPTSTPAPPTSTHRPLLTLPIPSASHTLLLHPSRASVPSLPPIILPLLHPCLPRRPLPLLTMGAFKTTAVAVVAAALVASVAAVPTSVRNAVKRGTKYVPCHYGYKEGYAYGFYDYNNNNNRSRNQGTVAIGGRGRQAASGSGAPFDYGYAEGYAFGYDNNNNNNNNNNHNGNQPTVAIGGTSPTQDPDFDSRPRYCHYPVHWVERSGRGSRFGDDNNNNNNDNNDNNNNNQNQHNVVIGGRN